MKQNKYDDPTFFTKYSQMARSIGGLEAASEWPAFRPLLPELREKDVLDLGCGFGWHCRYARAQQARSVVGVDLSEKMLARARESTHDPAIQYRRLAIEDIDFPKRWIQTYAWRIVDGIATTPTMISKSDPPPERMFAPSG